jgi:hypothetical protein
MIKRKGGSQIDNLTFDHNSLEIKGQMRFDWKDLFEGYKMLPLNFQKKNLFKKDMNIQIF